MRARLHIAVVGIGVLVSVPVRAGVVEFTDREEWIAAVGPFTTIGFTEYPVGTVITNQYAKLGVLFTDGNDSIFCCDETYMLNDGAGLWGNYSPLSPDFHLSFPIPQRWLALDFPDAIQIELYSQGQVVHTLEYGIGGPGLFVGVLSSQPFDAAVIRPPGFSQAYAFDDLHFGVPGPCTAAVFGAGALCCSRRRRRRRCQQTNRSEDRV